jgi:hypothetical protein
VPWIKDGELPEDILIDLAAATCTDIGRVKFEVYRRLLLAKVKEEEARLKAMHKRSGTTQAVDEFVARAQKRPPYKGKFKSTAPQLAQYLKSKNVAKGHYQERNRPILVQNILRLGLTEQEKMAVEASALAYVTARREAVAPTSKVVRLIDQNFMLPPLIITDLTILP